MRDGFSRYRRLDIPQLIHMRIVQQPSVHKAPPVARVPETSPIPDPEHTEAHIVPVLLQGSEKP